MKKEYVKPTVVVEEFMAEVSFLEVSGGGTVNPDKPVIPFSNERDEQRSGWGDLWN